ncbi:MAG: CRISPR-associated endonuclease Cas2 [Petrotogaceae bacterium]|nr:CRISPR-associated endonuclease Cas2 [Petrotogaceae bacterium]
MFIVMTYDIGEKRVSKVHKITKRYLNWVQRSVFEGEITQSKYNELRNKILTVINKKEDSVNYYKTKSKAYVSITNDGTEKNHYESII